MLTRELANQIQAEWLQATDMNLSSIRQFEGMIRAALALTQVQVAMANAGKIKWDYAAGMAAAVAAAEDEAPVGDGQYAAEFHRKFRAMWASYTVWLNTPISATVDGSPVTLTEKPLDIIMSTPQVGQASE